MNLRHLKLRNKIDKGDTLTLDEIAAAYSDGKHLSNKQLLRLMAHKQRPTKMGEKNART